MAWFETPAGPGRFSQGRVTGASLGWRGSLKSVVSLLVAFAPCAGAPIENQLRTLFAKLPDRNAVAAASVIDLASNSVVFDYNADQPLIPASTMKVFTMAAGLAELGPDFSFNTIFATDGLNLIVIGDGDPAFGDERVHKSRGETITADFERWAAVLEQQGLRTIPGDLILDETIFGGPWVHPTWEAADLDNWYAAPVGAVNFNDNCVDITVIPHKKLNTPVQVSVQPKASIIKISNGCKSGGKGLPVLNHAADSFEYVLSGRCNKTYPLGPASFPDPGLLFADSFRTVLAQQGIHLSGEIRRQRVRLPDGALPPSISILDRRRTPIADALRRIGKDSQNLFAECLLKRTGYARTQRHHQPDQAGTWESGAAAVHELMVRAGIDLQGLAVADGSGLSRQNRCTARQLSGVLAWVHRQPFAELFRDSLSIAGEDGSLRKRLKDLRGTVYCKTGTMKGIRSLAGFVYAQDGRVFAFASIFNNYKGGSAPYKEIQDKLCRSLVNASNQGPSGK